jgi:hypothetical protein
MEKDNVSLWSAPRWLYDVRHQTASTGVNPKSMRLVGNCESQPQTDAAQSRASKRANGLIPFHRRRPVSRQSPRGA